MVGERGVLSFWYRHVPCKFEFTPVAARVWAFAVGQPSLQCSALQFTSMPRFFIECRGLWDLSTRGRVYTASQISHAVILLTRPTWLKSKVFNSVNSQQQMQISTMLAANDPTVHVTLQMINAIISVISKYHHHLPRSQHSGSLPTVWETLIFLPSTSPTQTLSGPCPSIGPALLPSLCGLSPAQHQGQAPDVVMASPSHKPT
jgi:hypothetical protein